MTHATRENIRKQLLERRRQLLRRWRDGFDQEQELLSVREPDWEDLAAGQRDAGHLALLGEREVATLREIAAALERLEDGSYGECDECGEPIAEARLRIMPEARLCASCGQEREQARGHRGGEPLPHAGRG